MAKPKGDPEVAARMREIARRKAIGSKRDSKPQIQFKIKDGRQKAVLGVLR